MPLSESFLSDPYFEEAAASSFSHLNQPGVYTRFPFNSIDRPSVLDLAFANHALLLYFDSWSTPLPSTSSDHVAISILFNSPLIRPTPVSPNWKATDWTSVAPTLTLLAIGPSPPLPTSSSLASWFDASLSSITTPVVSTTPSKRPSTFSNPWWSPHLSSLQRIHHHCTRAFRRGQASRFQASLAWNSYFKTIAKAKAAHWDQFLAGADSQSVWNAKRFAYGRAPECFPSLPNAHIPGEINSTLISHFFPAPSPPPPATTILPPLANVPPITLEEVLLILKRSSSSSAPGLDSIPYGVWKNVHRANKDLLPSLLTPLLLHGYHPPTMKRANGIVLGKPGKADYRSPASFRIIVLLETVSKILERIVAYRLAEAAPSSSLINLHQYGSLAGLGCFDTVATVLTRSAFSKPAG